MLSALILVLGCGTEDVTTPIIPTPPVPTEPGPPTTIPEALPDAGAVLEEWVPMRDGTALYTRVHLPDPLPPEGVPVVLEREPYGLVAGGDDIAALLAAPFVERGYAWVYQDVRGRYASEGTFDPFNMAIEVADGADTTAWVRDQSWFGERLGTLGCSYSGMTALAAAVDNPDVDVVVANDAPVGAEFEIAGGVLGLHVLNWSHYLDHNAWLDPADLGVVGNALDLSDLDESVLGHASPLWQDLLAEPSQAWLDDHTNDGRYGGVCTPVLSIQSANGLGALDTWLGLSAESCSEVRADHRVILTPEAHCWHTNSLYGAPTEEGQVILDTLDHWLADVPTDLSQSPPILYRSTPDPGLSGAWSWPVSDAEDVLYLQNADDVRFAGGLVETPSDRDPLQVELDPESMSMCGDTLQTYPVFSYLTPPLAQPRRMIGGATVDLWVQTDAIDADVYALLYDYDPITGAAELAHYGRVRLGARDGSDTAEVPLDTPLQVTFTLEKTMQTFPAGHQVLLSLTNNLCDGVENPLTGDPPTEREQWSTARFSVLTSRAHPSRLVLPVLDGSPDGWP